MFDLSWAEMAVVMIVGILVIGPKDMPVVIRNIKKFSHKAKEITSEIIKSFDEDESISDLKNEVNKINKDIKTIVDLEGNIQPTYDISDIMPEIEKSKRKKNGMEDQ